MKRTKVVLVIKNGNEVMEWVPARLEEAGIDLVEAVCWTKEELARNAGDADIVWAHGGRHDLLEGENLAVLKKCGAILRTGAGTDNIDRKTATKLGIIVVNTPDQTTDSVADHTISLLFSLVRLVPWQDRLMRQGTWDPWLLQPGRRFRGATLGFLGFGRAPRMIIGKLIGFTMNFMACDPNVSAEDMAFHGVKKVSLEEMLPVADYVSLHCPLLKETHHLIGELELRLMQPRGLLVNTARGKLIDEPVLIQALREGWIGGAALDVLEKEPPDADNPLLTMDNVILTGHFAGRSEAHTEECSQHSVRAIMDLAQGRWPRSVVNPEVAPRWGKLSPPLISD